VSRKKKKNKQTQKKAQKKKLRQDKKRKEKLSWQQKMARTRTSGARFPFNVREELGRAVKYQQTGQIEKAEEICRRILKIDRFHADALHLLGVLADQTGKKEDAIKFITKAIKNDPDVPDYYVNLGCTFFDMGELSKAVSAFEKALVLKPDLPEIYNNMASALWLQGKTEQAITSCKKALELKPNYFEAYNSLGNVLQSEGRTEEAIANFQKAVELRPSSPECQNNLGQAFQELGKSEEAIISCKKALELKPDFAEAHVNLGNALISKDKFDEALSCFEKAININPNIAQAYNGLGRVSEAQHHFEAAASHYEQATALNKSYFDAYINLGRLMQKMGRANEAIPYYLKVLEIKPDYVDAYNNLGNLLQAQGMIEMAITHYQTALDMKPDQPEVYNNLGIAFADLGQLEDAISSYRKAIDLQPDLGSAYDNLVHALQQTCSWEEFQNVAAKLEEISKDQMKNHVRPAETPFISVLRTTDQAYQYAIAKFHSKEISTQCSQPLTVNPITKNERISKKRITIGYLSSDFFDHATAHLMLGLFGLHDRDQFEVICYSYGKDDESYYTERIRKDSDRFVDLYSESYAEAARLIYEDQVDILVDLKGYTKGNRLEICAYHPAPVQVTYLGFPGTTGADFIDYVITDKVVTPESFSSFYSEKFVYLPNSYQVNDHTQAISPKRWRKSDLGIPESSFVFSSFNQAYKIEPLIFDVWMEILHQVPESILWLFVSNRTAKMNLVREAEKRGIDGGRLLFAKKLPKDEHLARLKISDLSLDTRIVNGHTTTSDALWAGIPVITLEGSHFASRVSASVLKAVGLPDLITRDLEEYKHLAIRLANNQKQLHIVSNTLAKSRLVKPLFDTPRFVLNLEKAYKAMWDIFCAGERPRQIIITEN
jgi:protein O-GlcNAc transferase